MSSQMAEAIRQLIQDKGYSEEAVLRTIENTLKAAYKRKFGTNANAVVKFSDDKSDVLLYSRKTIVDGVYDPVTEIELEEALELSPDCEVGDEIDIPIDPKEFDRSVVQTGKQTAQQSLSEIQKDSLYAEYKDKVGEIIIGYYQREKNGNIYVDLGKVEGILPAKFQSSREFYHKNDRIKALITDIKKVSSGLQIILSRTDPDFVRSILELEIPEIYDKTVEIHKIVREPGYRTKVAVFSRKEDIDPVGACVGLKGVRIQSVIKELEGEKIDILPYDPDPRVFIKNALSPAEVDSVFITDEGKRQALAVVTDSQFSLAIGKQGLNVRLANRLCDWSIDVKTQDQCGELDELLAESRRAAEELFAENDEVLISEFENVDTRVAEILIANNVNEVNAFMNAYEDGSLAKIEGLSQEDIEALYHLINDSVEFTEEQEVVTENSETEEEYEYEEEEYECPECGEKITIDMTTCPSCGIELSFEYEDEE